MPSFVTYSDEQDQIGYLPETTWGTANAVDAAYRQLLAPKGTKIEIPVKHTDLGNDRTVRQQVGTDIFVDNWSGPVQVTIPSFILTKDRAADLLYAVLQNKVSEGGSTAYAKVFKCHTSQPDFTANAGYFFTLAWKGPVASKHILVTSCILKELTLSFDKGGGGDQGLVRASCVILGKKATIGQALTGTWVAQGVSRYNSYDFSFKYADTNAMEWSKVTIKIDNGARPLDQASDGTPKTFYLDWPKPNGLTAEALSWYNANTTGTIADLLALRSAGTLTQFSMGTSIAVGTDGNLKATFYGILDKDPQGTENRQMTVPISLLLAHNSAATNDAIIVNISDAIDQTP